MLFAMLVRLFLGQAETRPTASPGPHGARRPGLAGVAASLLTETGDRPLKVVVASRSQAAEGLGAAAGAFKVFTRPPFRRRRPAITSSSGRDDASHRHLPRVPAAQDRRNPKFLKQILGAMRKAGLVAPGPSGPLEVDEDRLASTAFPDTLEGLLLARADGLPEEERSLLKAASVLGPSFSLYLLQTLTEHPQDSSSRPSGRWKGGVVRMDPGAPGPTPPSPTRSCATPSTSPSTSR